MTTAQLHFLLRHARSGFIRRFCSQFIAQVSVSEFGQQADAYAKYRPVYPAQLFQWLSLQAPCRDLAWDVATGNGQSAVGFSGYFKRIVATDISAEQLRLAEQRPNVEYKQLPANLSDAQCEQHGFLPNSFDLISVATGVHWFELDHFNALVQRLLKKPKGIYAIWAYNRAKFKTDSPSIDEIVQRYRTEIVGQFWNEKAEHCVSEYRDIPFPFVDLKSVPSFQFKASWSLEHLYGYLESWSATQKAKEKLGNDPVDQIRADVDRLWGKPAYRRPVRMPIFMRVGRPIDT